MSAGESSASGAAGMEAQGRQLWSSKIALETSVACSICGMTPPGQDRIDCEWPFLAFFVPKISSTSLHLEELFPSFFPFMFKTTVYVHIRHWCLLGIQDLAEAGGAYVDAWDVFCARTQCSQLLVDCHYIATHSLCTRAKIHCTCAQTWLFNTLPPGGTEMPKLLLLCGTKINIT